MNEHFLLSYLRPFDSIISFDESTYLLGKLMFEKSFIGAKSLICFNPIQPKEIRCEI
jgi:hypothetical protein